MIDIQISVEVDLLIPIPESSSGDTVTYEIFDSDGNVIDSGNATFVRDEIWKVADFTPEEYGFLTLKVHDETLDSKRENFYRVVGEEIAPPSGDWGDDLSVGSNTWATSDEAETYFATRFGASEFWSSLTNSQKKSALVTAYNQILNCKDFEFSSSVSDITENMKKAQFEQALFLAIHGSDALRRKGLQAQGVVQAGIVKEVYDLARADKCSICQDAHAFLKDYIIYGAGLHVADIDRDEEIDAGEDLTD